MTAARQTIAEQRVLIDAYRAALAATEAVVAIQAALIAAIEADRDAGLAGADWPDLAD